MPAQQMPINAMATYPMQPLMPVAIPFGMLQPYPGLVPQPYLYPQAYQQAMDLQRMQGAALFRTRCLWACTSR